MCSSSNNRSNSNLKSELERKTEDTDKLDVDKDFPKKLVNKHTPPEVWQVTKYATNKSELLMMLNKTPNQLETIQEMIK